MATPPGQPEPTVEPEAPIVAELYSERYTTAGLRCRDVLPGPVVAHAASVSAAARTRLGRRASRARRPARHTWRATTQDSVEALERDHALIERLMQRSLFLSRDCSNANTYYIDQHGDAPVLRPVTLSRARRESRRFPLTDHRYRTVTPAATEPVPAGPNGLTVLG